MKAYIYILNGKVVINPKEKPLPGAFVKEDFRSFHTKEELKEFATAIKEWESNCIEVENTRHTPGGGGISIYVNHKHFHIKEGQQVEHEGLVITEIL